MTQEEKAKAYDKALERAKDLISRCKTDRDRKTMIYRLEDIKSLFPELAESEDERIRKQLLNWFKECHWEVIDDGTLKRDDIIAWLERQGEQEATDNKEKLNMLNFIRKETCCGLAEANNALLELIKVLKERPLPIMDKHYKLKIEWENK